jgi:hypothetical protein
MLRWKISATRTTSAPDATLHRNFIFGVLRCNRLYFGRMLLLRLI